MKLTDLNARFVRAEADGVFSEFPETAIRANGIQFDCPCGCTIRQLFFFLNVGDDAPYGSHPSHHRWTRQGETLDGLSLHTMLRTDVPTSALTLRPSILIHPTPNGPCKGWHGYVTAGLVESVP